ncbi:phosphate ABC transporter permease PstA [Halorarum salinum]|uniref:Phosphate transport system permease protein PstA n=1 Tax=Halorarum salinum TaxID=2743089 RepID=A0A7D5L867_9EURY|nr:phosphate ABC transporter permease PstA [Halobaculum salinum]QLG60413.1 phosphate ABC transporter permease PstA [Halobaculum salinum]
MATERSRGGRHDSAPATESVSRLRGRLFEGVTLGATVFGLAAVAFLLAYVFNDALRPLSADPRWHAVFLSTTIAPSLALAWYYYDRDPAAGEVAYATLGVPVVGLLVGGWLAVLFVEVVTPAEWFAALAGLSVGAGAVLAHRRLRPGAALERLAVLGVGPAAGVVGATAVMRSLPVVPVGWMLLVASVTAPAALAFGRVVARRRDDGRGVEETLLASVLVASIGAVLSPIVGLTAGNWVLLATATLLPTGAYLEGVLRRGEGLSGLAFPVVVVGGAALGAVVVRSLGFAGPEPWLDWGFLTSPTSRTPADAGIYPPLVGSVLMLVVIVVSAFPVGVGAAIYLEEYAPASGRAGRFVDLVEINIGNLAGVPSVVYGLLGLALFIRGVGLESGIVVVGGLTVGLLVLPIVVISAQEAIRAVPESRRAASYGMGATKWQTTRNVVLPEALPGILTGTILALGRAIGETAPLLMIGAASSVRLAPSGFFAKFSAMPRQLFAWSSEIKPEFRFGVLAAGVVTLLVVLLVMNGTAILVRNRYQRSR